VIDLAVSEVNGCNYCLAAHTAIAKGAGFTEGQTLEFREGYSPQVPSLMPWPPSLAKLLFNAESHLLKPSTG